MPNKLDVRRFPYAGNSPVVRWNGCAEEVVDLLLRETLRHVYAWASLEKRKREDYEVFPVCPELITIVDHEKGKRILYPDPPLANEELAVISKTDITVETRLERHATDRQCDSCRLSVALYVSEADDIGRFGLGLVHLESFFLELSRYLLLAGVRLAYGGHLGKEGYTHDV